MFKRFELQYTALLKRLNYDRECPAKGLLEEAKDHEGRKKVDKMTKIAMTAGSEAN